jgi:hypothetical protein
MNILFLTISKKIANAENEGIYYDLLKEFADNSHKVFAVAPIEKKDNRKNCVRNMSFGKLLEVNIGNYFDVGAVEKGLTLLTLEHNYLKAIKYVWKNIKFDLVLYSTPPITFNHIVSYFKSRGAYSYLMLKDIFPQNAVDLGMMSKKGVKGLLYQYFRKQEKELYKISDTIGCMSQANIEYVLRHNSYLGKEKLELCPNAIRMREHEPSDKNSIRVRYDIPLDKLVFVYGGNLGKPQGAEFILECLKKNEDFEGSYILIVGSGSEYSKFENWINNAKPKNCKLIKYLPKNEYMEIVKSADIGLLFLDYRFTIPNFPSRLLSYMEIGLPVLAATDPNTDVGSVIEKGGFGWWCHSNSIDDFMDKVSAAKKSNLVGMGQAANDYLRVHFNVKYCYSTIIGKL